MDNLKIYFETQKLDDMHRFLGFITDEKILLSCIEKEWEKLYDTSFVKNEIMYNLKRWMPQLRNYVAEIKNTLENNPTKPHKIIQITKPIPFDLHKPKPKRVPIPESIPDMSKARKVPYRVYAVSVSNEKFDKREPTVLLKKYQSLVPSCTHQEISQKSLLKLNNIILERDKELKFDSLSSNPVPKSTSHLYAQLKLNTTVVLREWKLYENKIEKKKKQLKQLEEGSFNSLQFESWQQSLRALDLEKNISHLEKLKLYGKLSYEEAILKREKLIHENQAIVNTLKNENAERFEIFEKEKEAKFKKIKKLVDQIIASDENIKEAKLSVHKQKEKIAKEIIEESRCLQEKALIEAETEMRRKVNLISEIRALEGSHITNKKILDPTEISGDRFLCEMSLAELKERLILLKQKYNENLIEKNKEILEIKQNKEKSINKKLELIRICRSKFQDNEINGTIPQSSSSENLNEKQLAELKGLRDQLEEKRIMRQRKNQKSSSAQHEKINQIVSQNSILKPIDLMDKYRTESHSGTLEIMSQILSI